MALVTTFMAGPLLRLIDPRMELSEPVEEELRRAKKTAPEELEVAVPTRSILVAPQDISNLDALLALAEPLAQSTPPREIILAQVMASKRFVTGTQLDAEDVAAAAEELNRRRDELVARGIAARAIAFTAISPGHDIVRLSSEQEVDLVLLDGRRPLLGEGVPRGDVGTVLDRAPADVAVLVEREGMPTIDREHPVIVPFGGGDHDWAAVELAAWIASSYNAPMKLLGAGGRNGEGDASRLLASASLVVQQLAGVTAEPVLVGPAEDDLLQAAEAAGLLVIGLSDRWRQEGLGRVRASIAKAAPAPILFVRRGSRQGALAPAAGNETRFAWSRVGPPAPVG
jgi:hypothetical protein